MKIIYRISDGSNVRARIATKAQCFHNFLRAWDGWGRGDEMVILRDGCSDATKRMIDQLVKRRDIIKTDIIIRDITAGSSERAFQHAMAEAIEEQPSEAMVYLVEDDYLHLSGSRKALIEGLSIADYVTLYDHPDKYAPYREEPTRVLLTASSHWKLVRSTTATFATTAGVLRQDEALWKKGTDGTHGLAWDNEVFSFLTTQRFRMLVSPIPGFATHAEAAWLGPLGDWREIVDETL